MTKDGETKSFSLVESSQWMDSGDQQFFDLHTLIKNGIPSTMRKIIWKDLVRVSYVR